MTRMLALKVLAISLCLATFSVCRAADDEVGPGPSDYLGMHIHRSSKSPWPPFTFGWWRLWDAGVSWKNLQPKAGPISFETLDRTVALAEAKGVKLVYLFRVTPEWASARPSELGAYGPGSAAEPARMEDWRAFVRTVVSRYKGRIAYYEIWNEPNWKNFYTGSWTRLAEMVHEVRLAVDELSPGSHVILPGLASEHGLTVIGEFLKTGVAKDVDVVGYHFYTGHRPPEVLPRMVSRLRVELNVAGAGAKPIWNTEFGWLVEGKGRAVDPGAVGFSKKDKIYSEEEAASFLVRAYTLLRSAGVERSFYYAWDNEAMGTFDPKTNALKESMVVAFDVIGRWLRGPAPTCSTVRSTYECQVGGSGQSAVVWSDGEPLVPSALSRNWRTAEDIRGQTFDLNTLSERSLTSGPYLVRK